MKCNQISICQPSLTFSAPKLYSIDYLRLNYSNLVSGKENNFAMLNNEEVNSLGEPYDFASIMHYAPSLFSKAKTSNVIIPKVNISKSLLSQIGQRIKLSKGDVIQINKMYNCPRMLYELWLRIF